MSNEKTREELRSDLETYQKQLLEVERLRSSEGKEEGEEEELRELEIELREFVRITLDLLRDAGAEPGAVVEWKEGEKCMAKYHEDGEWYPAVVVELHPNEKLTVEFEGYGNQEVLGAEDLKKLITEDKVTEQPRPEVYQGVAAPKRPRAGQEVLQTRTEMPKRMQIREGDDEATIAKKRKMIRSFKKAQRSQTLDAITQEKQAAWKSFQKSKLSKGKPGFLTGKRVGKGGGAL